MLDSIKDYIKYEKKNIKRIRGNRKLIKSKKRYKRYRYKKESK